MLKLHRSSIRCGSKSIARSQDGSFVFTCQTGFMQIYMSSVGLSHISDSGLCGVIIDMEAFARIVW